MKTKSYIKILRHPSLLTDLRNIHTRFQATKWYNKWDIHVEKIYVKNDDFQILHTFNLHRHPSSFKIINYINRKN